MSVPFEKNSFGWNSDRSGPPSDLDHLVTQEKIFDEPIPPGMTQSVDGVYSFSGYVEKSHFTGTSLLAVVRCHNNEYQCGKGPSYDERYAVVYDDPSILQNQETQQAFSFYSMAIRRSEEAGTRLKFHGTLIGKTPFMLKKDDTPMCRLSLTAISWLY